MFTHTYTLAIGGPEWVIIGIAVVLLLVIFNPKTLPKIGNSFGKTIKGLRKGLTDDKDKNNKDDEPDKDSDKVSKSETVVEVKEVENVSDTEDKSEDTKEDSNNNNKDSKPVTKKKVVRKNLNN